MRRGIVEALLAAALFGASTPFAKLLTARLTPTLLAGLLYAGSGVGLCAWLLLRRLLHQRQSLQQRQGDQVARLGRADVGWLAGAILAGGVAGPLLLLWGLGRMPASNAALLLNLEGVLTALLAWFVFHENFDRRLLLGMAAIVGAGVLLSWQEGPHGALAPGALAILGACACWALDNNLTRKVAAGDAVQIAACKGIAAGSVNLVLAWSLGSASPALTDVLSAGLLGFFGYGLSLVLFVRALRQLGTARTGAYFSLAPFAGAAIAIVFLHDDTGAVFWLAAALMGVGLWLHLSERHGHWHRHDKQFHTHEHVHGTPLDTDPADPHHEHTHDFVWDGSSPHSHAHAHPEMAHTHPHFPDIHHRHRH